MTTCVISQPRFFPGLHYLDRMLIADVFVIFDTVQYNPRHEENRAKLRTSDGTMWLTAPMRRESRSQLISDTCPSDQPWQTKAIRSLENLYSGTPGYDAHAHEVSEILTAEYSSLTEFDLATWQPALRMLKPDVEFVRASTLSASGSGPDLLISICQELSADRYVSGGFGRDYLDAGAFEEASIELAFHDYDHPVYPQRHDPFVPYLSYLDLLFNTGTVDPALVRGNTADQLARIEN